MTYQDRPPNDWFNLHPAAVWLLKFVVVAVTVLVVAVFGARLARELGSELASTQSADSAEVVVQSIEIPPGISDQAIGWLLEEAGIIDDAELFLREVIVMNAEIRPGEYELVPASADLVVKKMLEGPSSVFRLTVVEGLTVAEMLDSIAEDTVHTRDELEAALLSGAVESSLLPSSAPVGSPELARWEGLLFPNTYEFREDATATDILALLARTLEEQVDAQDWEVLTDLGYTPSEGLIIASLIEREAKLDVDRELISGVIANRLDKEMKLQIDATVIYALDEKPERVLYSHLETDSPYNTYRVAGLPPTPISGIRLDSLKAAAKPAEHDFLYYVVVDSAGRHGFSETLEEHERKIAEARAAGVIP